MTEKSSNSIAENIKRLRERINVAAMRSGREPDEIGLMAVTKTQPVWAVNAAIACGIRLIGENKAQELCQKYEEYDKECSEIHFIGHLQTNKVKQVVGKISMIESVDSMRLAGEIDRHSQSRGLVTDLLIEVNIGGEQTKSGVEPSQVHELAREIAELRAVKLRGLMAIPPVLNGNDGNEAFFAAMRQLFVDIKSENIDNTSIDCLSMGMSDDFEAAIRQGSTQVRLGSAIFGHRG